jgi:hypothetical protein
MLCSDFVTNTSFACFHRGRKPRVSFQRLRIFRISPPASVGKLEQVVVVDELPSVKTESPAPKGYKFGLTEGRCSGGSVSRFTELKNSLR